MGEPNPTTPPTIIPLWWDLCHQNRRTPEEIREVREVLDGNCSEKRGIRA